MLPHGVVFVAVVCQIVAQPARVCSDRMHGLFIGDEVLLCGAVGCYCFGFSLSNIRLHVGF